MRIGNNNLKTFSKSKTTRVLAEQSSSLNNTVTRHTSSIQSQLMSWMESIQDDFINEVQKLYQNSTQENINNFLDWMHNKSLVITKALNVSPYLMSKKLLNDTLGNWNKLSELVVSSARAHNGSSMLLGNYGHNNSSLSNTSLSSQSSISLSNNDSLTNTSVLTDSASEILQNITSMISNNSVIEVVSKEQNVVSDACSSIFCDPSAVAGISASVAVVGGLMLFAFLYKRIGIRSLLSRNSIKEERGRKRLLEKSLENVENPSESPEETGETQKKRSRLNDFLEAFGYKYRKIFPYVEQDTKENAISRVDK